MSPIELLGLVWMYTANPGHRFFEIVYKMLSGRSCRKDVLVEREKEFKITNKKTILPHQFYADLIIDRKIILTIKAAGFTMSAVIFVYVMLKQFFLKEILYS